jgi:hypothetical protein
MRAWYVVQQDALLKELKEHSKEQEAAPGSWDSLLESQEPSVMFPRTYSSASSHGTFDFGTSVKKDRNFAESSRNITSTAYMERKHDSEIETDENPLHDHDIFKDLRPRARSSGSSLSAHQQNSPTMPVIHLHIPGNNQPIPVPGPFAVDHAKLLTRPKISATLGPDLNIEDFCHIYKLDNEILMRLKRNGYHRTKTFKHITIPQLRDMEFKHGEIASLQDAVDEWTVSAESG